MLKEALTMQDGRKWKDDFLKNLEESRRLMPSTLRIYDSELERLLELIESGAEVQGLKKELGRFAPATAIRKLVIWRSFLKTCPPPWDDFADKIDSPKLRQKQPRFLNDEEIFLLESACYRSREPARDRLLIGLGLQLGLRVTEILNLKFQDFEKDWLRIIRKGGGEQRLPLTTSLQALVHFWRTERKANAQDYVFPGRGEGPMSVRNAQKLLASLAASAGISGKVHPHALRHSFATRMAANGISLVALKEFLGHRRMSTTERYMHVTPQHLQESLRFLKPPR